MFRVAVVGEDWAWARTILRQTQSGHARDAELQKATAAKPITVTPSAAKIETKHSVPPCVEIVGALAGASGSVEFILLRCQG